MTRRTLRRVTPSSLGRTPCSGSDSISIGIDADHMVDQVHQVHQVHQHFVLFSRAIDAAGERQDCDGSP
ncbi:hypothetical protein B7R21_19520 [Subtercola boreus]|uniref:Uncharacterized protein n=1 Tax=Subtercola boreus TaxID=120213 RepID=A0A3E0VA06_9MICO|nr:hypothetical protein B7R21_19520 [Subtercola boreus]